MDTAKKLVLFKRGLNSVKSGWNGGRLEELYWLSGLKKSVIFVCTMEKHGPENWEAHSCFFVVLQLLLARGFTPIRDQMGSDDLSVSKRIKPETGVADVPKPGTQSVLFFGLFSSVKFDKYFL